MSFAKIIEEERGKRLATIDTDAAATQARVEVVEKEIDAKKRAEQEAEEAAMQPLTPPVPNPAPPPKGK